MKAKFTLMAVLVAAFFLGNAQTAPVVNGGFETWTSNSTPTGWTTYAALIPQLDTFNLSAKDTVDKHELTASIKLSNAFIPIANPPQGDTIGGAVSIGSGFFNGQEPKLYGMPFTSRPDTISFWYKYVPVGNDTCGFSISLSRSDSVGYLIGAGFTLGSSAQWVPITLPLKQFYVDTVHGADTLMLFFTSSFKESTKPRIGSVMHVDQVRFGYKTAPLFIENIDNNLTVRVFPNPSTDLVKIQTSEPVNNASIVVYDMTGRIITHEVGGSQNFELVTQNWESGMYSYSILSGGVVVNKGRISVQH